jgi:hypothetical protein
MFETIICGGKSLQPLMLGLLTHSLYGKGEDPWMAKYKADQKRRANNKINNNKNKKALDNRL